MSLVRVLTLAGLFVAASAGEARAADLCVVGQRWDAVLGKAWNVVSECGHPERPVRLASASTQRRTASVSVAAAAPIVLVVRAGDVVRLWQQAENVRIQMVGVAERSAGVGDRVSVRIERAGLGDGFEVRRMDGIVRGAGDVEIER